MVAYKKAREIFYTMKVREQVIIDANDYGLQVRNSLYQLQRRHLKDKDIPEKMFTSRIKEGKLKIWRII